MQGVYHYRTWRVDFELGQSCSTSEGRLCDLDFSRFCLEDHARYRKCLEPLNDPCFDWSLGLFLGGCPSRIRGHLGSKWLGSPPFTSHEIRLFGRGPTTWSLGVNNDHHGQINQVSKSWQAILQVLGPVDLDSSCKGFTFSDDFNSFWVGDKGGKMMNTWNRKSSNGYVLK